MLIHQPLFCLNLHPLQGHVFMWGSDRENFKRRSSSSLLYQILFSLSGRSGSTVRPVLPTIKEEPQPKQLAIKDAAGAAFDQKINVSKTEVDPNCSILLALIFILVMIPLILEIEKSDSLLYVMKRFFFFL